MSTRVSLLPLFPLKVCSVQLKRVSWTHESLALAPPAGLFCLEIEAQPVCSKAADCYYHCYPFTWAAVCKDGHCYCD
ncbi:hypothetical protein HAX54_049401 [Datura stramonium]|uniref:Uncharacterized protein n=1 Tax=Datura stramonium TaxID=4076 RepID=A0ABS8SUX6_DATST|nr:hypothetical protein [Datura stramonium]